MIDDKQAIKKAVDYLNSLTKELPGNLLDHPDRIKLESIQQFPKEWVVTLSYFSKATNKSKPDWLNFLEGVRRFKEFAIDRNSGTVIAMRDPTVA